MHKIRLSLTKAQSKTRNKETEIYLNRNLGTRKKRWNQYLWFEKKNHGLEEKKLWKSP